MGFNSGFKGLTSKEE